MAGTPRQACLQRRPRPSSARGIPEGFGGRPLASITPMHVQGVVDARAKLVSAATLARDFSALRAVLNSAVNADIIGRSPARKIALPRPRPPRRVGLRPDELEKLASEAPGRYRALVLVAGILGLRWGEAVGLRVRDIDFLRRTVTVSQVVEETAGHIAVVRGAKTDAGLRTLSAPAFLVDELARHLAEYRQIVAGDPEGLVFVGPRGGILRCRFAERTFAPAVTRAGLDHSLTFHGLRHAAITTMVELGVHPRVMQGRAGHATSKLTLELYAHVPRLPTARPRSSLILSTARLCEVVRGRPNAEASQMSSPGPSRVRRQGAAPLALLLAGPNGRVKPPPNRCFYHPRSCS